MNPNDPFRIDLLAARYLTAVETFDFDTQERIWAAADEDPELETALNEVHRGLIAEWDSADVAATADAVADAATKHLTSGEVVREDAGPVTVADVAAELFRHPPARLPAEVHAFNERIRGVRTPLPADLGLFALVDWFAANFGPTDEEYVTAFREAAVKLRMRSSAEADFRLAARRSPPAGGGRG